MVDLCYFALFEDFSLEKRLKVKSISLFFLKNNDIFLLHKNQTPVQTCKMAAK
jgi:hypothetical protein